MTPEGEELGRAEEEDGEDGPATDEEAPQMPMADTEMPQTTAADEEMPQAPGGEEPMWTRMRQMQTSQARLQELVSSQRTAGTRTGLGTEGGMDACALRASKAERGEGNRLGVTSRRRADAGDDSRSHRDHHLCHCHCHRCHRKRDAMVASTHFGQKTAFWGCSHAGSCFLLGLRP